MDLTCNISLLSGVCLYVQLYAGDLESEFGQFQDRLQTFPLYKGKASPEDEDEDEEERLMGKYKVLCMESCLSVTLTRRLDYSTPAISRAPSWFIPLNREMKTTPLVRSPRESPKTHRSKSWSGPTSSRWDFHNVSCVCILP